MRTFRRSLARFLVWSTFLAAGFAIGAPTSAQSKGGGKPTPPPPPPNIPRPICFNSTTYTHKLVQMVLQRADVNGTSIITVNSGLRSITEWARWSPDGSMIGGYHKNVDRGKNLDPDTALMVMTPDGANERVVMTASRFNAWNLARPGVVDSGYSAAGDFPCWLGNDAFIFAGRTAYDAELYGGAPGETIIDTRLFIVDANGMIAPLTEAAALGAGDFCAHWSAALNKIVFVGARPFGGSFKRELEAINPDGTGRTQITYTGWDWRPEHAVWSPLGDRLAVCVRTSSGYFHLWLLDVNLSQPNPGMGEGGRVTAALPFKTPINFQVHSPSWSPDGRYLVYYSSGGIVIADVATGAEQIVSASGTHPDWDPLDFGL